MTWLYCSRPPPPAGDVDFPPSAQQARQSHLVSMEHEANFGSPPETVAVAAISPVVVPEIWEYPPAASRASCMSRTQPPRPVTAAGIML